MGFLIGLGKSVATQGLSHADGKEIAFGFFCSARYCAISPPARAVPCRRKDPTEGRVASSETRQVDGAWYHFTAPWLVFLPPRRQPSTCFRPMQFVSIRASAAEGCNAQDRVPNLGRCTISCAQVRRRAASQSIGQVTRVAHSGAEPPPPMTMMSTAPLSHSRAPRRPTNWLWQLRHGPVLP